MGQRPFSRLTLAPLLLAAITVAQAEGTRYTVGKRDGVSWFFDSQGRPLWSFGVCVVDQGVGFDDYKPDNPAYGAWRFYPSRPDWAQGAVQTLRDGGFNTIGAWSAYRPLLDVPGNDLKFTPVLHNGSTAGFPWLDMWDPELVAKSDAVAKSVMDPLKNDDRVIGYFSDNEIGWWKPAVFEWVWKQKTLNTRRRVVDLLKKRYHASWSKLTKDFDPGKTSSFGELARKGDLKLRPGGNGIHAVGEVLGFLADRYYSLCRAQIKKHDPRALYLGDRYISNYYPEVAKAAGRYCDVVSTNLNANWKDGGYVRYHLEGLRKLTGKPLMVTEYYMCAVENRSGNKNDSSGFPVVQTLTERATGCRNTTLALLHTPDVVGAHWFQYYDEPQKGRGDGENYNFGLVDVNNQPYRELLATVKAIDLLREHQTAKDDSKADAIPPAPADKDHMEAWDRPHALRPSTSPVPRGDLYLAWTPTGLELRLLWSEELFSESYFRGGKVPLGESTLVEIKLAGTTPWRRRVVAKQTLWPGDPWQSQATYGTSAQLAVTVPASALGRTLLSANQRVTLEVTLVSQAKAYKTNWHVKATLLPSNP